MVSREEQFCFPGSPDVSRDEYTYFKSLLYIKTLPHTIIKQKLTDKDGATSFSC